MFYRQLPRVLFPLWAYVIIPAVAALAVTACFGSTSSQGPVASEISSIEALTQQGEQQLESGRSSLDVKGLTIAQQDFQRCIQEQSSNFRCYYDLARTEDYLHKAEANAHHDSVAKKWLDEAIESVETAIARNDHSADAHALLGDLYGEKISGMFSGMKYGPQANAEVEKALQIDPHSATAYAVLGRKYLFSPPMFGGDINKAIDSFRKATVYDSQSYEDFVWLAIAYRKQGDTSNYQQAISRALELNPASAFAHRVSSGAGTE